jgi:hypothetical protein
MSEEITPKIGMGATEIMGTDRYPFTIIQIASKNRLIVQADKYSAIGTNTANNQNYEYKPDTNGKTEKLILTKYGWKILGEPVYFKIGYRKAFYDWGF